MSRTASADLNEPAPSDAHDARPAPGRTTLTSRLPPSRTPQASTAAPSTTPSAPAAEDPFGLHLLGSSPRFHADRPLLAFDQQGLAPAPPQRLGVRHDAGDAPSKTPIVIEARLDGGGEFAITPATRSLEPGGATSFDVTFTPTKPGAQVGAVGLGAPFLPDEVRVPLIAQANMAVSPGPVDPAAPRAKAPATAAPARDTDARPPGARSSSIGGVSIATIEQLIRASRAELDHEHDLDALAGSTVRNENGDTFASATRVFREQYRQFSEELRMREEVALFALNEHGKGNPDNSQISPASVADWEFAVTESGALRRQVAVYLVDHYKEVMKDRDERLRSAAADLQRYRVILKDILDANHAVHLAKLVTEIGEYAEAVEHLGHVFHEEHVTDSLVLAGATGAKIQIGHYAEIIEKGMEGVAAYFEQVALAPEGLTSFEDLEEHMKATTEDIASIVAQQAEDRPRLDRAVASTKAR